MAEDKRTQLNIRLTPEDYALVSAAARDAGLGLSSWLRMVARKAARLQLRTVAVQPDKAREAA